MGTDGVPNDTRRRGRLSLAALLFVLALGIRWIGIDHGLPHFGEPDAYIVQQAESMIHDGITDRDRAGWKYPHLVGTILALVPPEPVQRLDAGASLEKHRELATRLRLQGRKVVAVLSSLAAPAAYLIAARFLGARFAFLAGLFVATSLLHICFSVQARPHGPVSGFATLAILAVIRWRERPSLWRAAVAGAAVGASISTLHSGAAALAPAAAAFLGLLRSHHPKGKTLLGALCALGLVGSAAGWFCVRAEDGYGLNPNRTPGAIAKRHGGLGDAKLDKLAGTGRSHEDVYEGQAVLRFSGHVVPLSFFNGNGFFVAADTLSGYDPVVLFYAVLGALALVALALRRGRKAAPDAASAAWITLAYGVPTFLMYGIYQASTDRFYLALMPVTCILAAYGAERLLGPAVDSAFGQGWIRTLTRAVGVVSIGAVIVAALALARLRVIPDTYKIAGDVILELTEGKDLTTYTAGIVGVPVMSTADALTRDAMWSRGPWDKYQWALLHPEKTPIVGEPEDAPRTGAPPTEAANRLGIRMIPAPAATRLKVYHAENRAAAAREALAETDPDIVLVATSHALGKGAVGPTAMRDAWMEGVRSDGRWVLERTIKNSRREVHYPLGFKLSFLDVLLTHARGPEIEIWTRR
ncbi:MAG: glycosyltransferase family 39 protein [Planctomycetota bacterium]